MVILKVLLILIFLNSLHAINSMRYCTINNEELRKCNHMRESFASKGLKPLVECVQAIDADGCIKMINKYEADVMSLDSGDIYKAGQEYNLIPIMAEVYGTDQGVPKPKYNAVAVVKASDKSITDLRSLKGKKSCHTGIGRSAGWIIPIGILLKTRTMDVADCNNPVLSASHFFKESCAPGAQNETYTIGGVNVDNMCNLCQGQGENHCSRSMDPFAGYDGAFKCLRDGGGDIAFVKDATPLQMTKDQSQSGYKASDFQLLCTDGSRKSIYESAECNWGSSPAHALMTLSGQSNAAKMAFKQLFLEAQKFFGVNGTHNSEFKLFGNSLQDYGRKDLLFKDSTIQLIDVGNRNTYQAYLGSYTNIIEGHSMCDVETLMFCVVSTAELKKLSDMSREFGMKGWKPKIIPVKGETHEACMQKVAKGDADLVVLDGGDVYTAGMKYGLVPIMYENYGQGDAASYYGVAVVKRNSNINIKNLKGVQSCHTGIGKTAGWNVPVNYLIESKQIDARTLEKTGCNVPKVISQFFKKSCAPGAKDPRFYKNPKEPNAENLCALCKGSGNGFCARSSEEPYYDYSGAFRCLVESKEPTVAFMKHTTVLANTDGNNQDEWSRNLLSEDFELLCKDGTRKPVQKWKECYLTKVPAEAIMVRATFSPQNRKTIQNLFVRAQETFGQVTKRQPETFSMFRSNEGQQNKNILFKDDTIKLEPITAIQDQNYRAFLGENYINMLKNLNCGHEDKPVRVSNSRNSNHMSGDLVSGAVAAKMKSQLNVVQIMLIISNTILLTMFTKLFYH